MPPLCRLFAYICCICTAPFVYATPASAAALEPDSVQAIWRVYKLSFNYSGSYAYYTCSALRSKVASILTALGAADEPLVEIRDCMPGELRKMARVDITVKAPAVANAENVREATTFDSTARLIARVRNARLPTAADLERFPAAWRLISLYSHSGLRLDPGDCELLRDMSETVFPQLEIRPSRHGLHCVSNGTRLRPRLEVAALMPVREHYGEN